MTAQLFPPAGWCPKDGGGRSKFLMSNRDHISMTDAALHIDPFEFRVRRIRVWRPSDGARPTMLLL